MSMPDPVNTPGFIGEHRNRLLASMLNTIYGGAAGVGRKKQSLNPRQGEAGNLPTRRPGG
jgi:hypothetical protein